MPICRPRRARIACGQRAQQRRFAAPVGIASAPGVHCAAPRSRSVRAGSAHRARRWSVRSRHGPAPSSRGRGRGPPISRHPDPARRSVMAAYFMSCPSGQQRAAARRSPGSCPRIAPTEARPICGKFIGAESLGQGANLPARARRSRALQAMACAAQRGRVPPRRADRRSAPAAGRGKPDRSARAPSRIAGSRRSHAGEPGPEPQGRGVHHRRAHRGRDKGRQPRLGVVRGVVQHRARWLRSSGPSAVR